VPLGTPNQAKSNIATLVAQSSNSPSDGIIPTSPGKVESDDQLESDAAGLIAQWSFKPIKVQSCHCL
jgi:hypothetical protein